jgi:MoaA/NifB/PqqE/SkfB family radical SAM enzyme
VAKDLRLLLFSDCNRRCKGCCNKDWDLDNLPICQSFQGYKTVMLTGGEPMLNPQLVKDTAGWIREENPDAKIIVYTAKSTPPEALIDVLSHVDGLTLTLHTQSDVRPFTALQERLYLLRKKGALANKSLRLNVFKGIDIGKLYAEGWVIKTGIEWIKNCPLPENEVFMRLG